MSDLSVKVFNDRYALKDESGNQIEHSFEEMWQRVAGGAAEAEKPEIRDLWRERFYNLLRDFKFVPGGRILSGLGSGAGVSFYNCFVIPSPDDSRGGIMDSVKTMTEIMSRGGGVGVNLSTLRPRGSHVKGVNGTASGAVSFGGLYSFATGLITQGGSRRGALMLVLDVSHPDIEEFVIAKKISGALTNANLSVAVSDEFMETLRRGGDWDLKWNGSPPHQLDNAVIQEKVTSTEKDMGSPNDLQSNWWGGKVYKTVKASCIWDLICEAAHASGEPGVVFLDRGNKLSNTWYHDKLISTNPCGEQMLPAWGVCDLGSLNLSAFYKNGEMDIDGLGVAVRDAVRFLDNIIDLTQYHFPETEKTQRLVRRIGLGIMGLADLLIKMKIRYGSDESVKFVEDICKFIRNEAYAVSVALAKEKGAFPAFDRENYIKGKFIQTLPIFLKGAIAQYGIRNAALLTQAPTGTISILADTSSGIEPIYDFKYIRKDRIGEHVVYHSLYEEYINNKKSEIRMSKSETSPTLSLPLRKGEGEGGGQNPDNEGLPDYFVSAKKLTPEEHVKMQATIQKYVDASISKTVNAPQTHSVDDVKKLYNLAYDSGCKGITYFREGSRSDAVLTSVKDEKKEASPNEEIHSPAKDIFGDLKPKDRPRIMRGETYKVPMGYGNMYVTLNIDEEGRLFEVFARIGKTGGFFEAKAEAICRLVSLALRSGIDVHEIIHQIKGIRGPMPSWGENGMILSIPDGIAQVMEEHITKAQQKLDLSFPSKACSQGASASSGEQPQTDEDKKEPIQLEKPAEESSMAMNINIPSEIQIKTQYPELAKELFSQKKVYAKFADIGEAPECPNCGGLLEFAEGCLMCRSCGYSKCA